MNARYSLTAVTSPAPYRRGLPEILVEAAVRLWYNPPGETATTCGRNRGALHFQNPTQIMTRFIRGATFLLVVLTTVNATAFEKFDFEQKFFAEPGQEVKDHTLLRVDGLYHLFYLRGNPAVNIGHAISLDLIHWTKLAPVLPIEPGTWEDGAVWAPQVFQTPFGYIMFYTGVNHYVSQQTGIAMSTDLFHWSRIPWPVYHPDTSWALWTDTGFAHGRDPFVFDYNGTHYLLNTAKTPYNKGAISLASSSDYFAWTDDGPLYVHNTWHVLESVQMIEHNGAWNLFYTEEAVNGTSWATNGQSNPLTGWDLSTGSVIDFGHAPEINQIDPGVYTFSRHTTFPKPGGGVEYVIRFDELKWAPTFPYIDKPWPLAADWTITSGSAFVFAPTFGDNPALRGDNTDIGYVGNGWASTFEQYQGPLGYGVPGSYQGEGATGSMISRTFTLSGNSISVLVGGTNSISDCYVALRNASNDQILFRDTGNGTDAMDRRYWNTKPYKGKDVYIEVVDNSTTGHICLDEIIESSLVIDGGVGGSGGARGRGKPVAVKVGNVPSEISLHQNTPNPFNPTTTIAFDLPQAADVSIDIYNVNGQRVRNLLSRAEEGGAHEVTWDARSDAGSPLPSGIYFYRLTVDGRTVATKKMILLK